VARLRVDTRKWAAARLAPKKYSDHIRTMSKAGASISNRKSSSTAAAMREKDSLTFVLHPKQLVALRSKATEILYGGANPRKAASAILVWLGAIKGLANASIQNNSGLPQGLAGLSVAG